MQPLNLVGLFPFKFILHRNVLDRTIFNTLAGFPVALR